MKKSLLIAVITTLLFSYGQIDIVIAQVNIGPGSTVDQYFEIGTSATATLPDYWKADKNTTVRTVGTYSAAVTTTEQRAGNNMSSSATNGIYNYAAGDPTSATDRAVGGLSSSSASKSVNIYVWLSNSGGSDITNFTISYNVEKYRNGLNSAGFSIQMYYSTDGSTWISAGSDFLSSFPADIDNTGYASAPGATLTVANKTLPVAVSTGSSIYLAWNYSVTSGTTTSNAQALGIDDVSITANGGGTPIAGIPSFSPIAGTYYTTQYVTISSSTSGASIYYTTDGTDPDNMGNGTLFTLPITINSNTTLKARAYATGYDPSAIETAVYTFPEINDVANIAALRAGTPGTTIYRLTGEAILTYKTSSYNVKYIQDATGAIIIYDAGGIITTSYNLYDGITGIIGTLTLYNGMLEFIPVTNSAAASSSGNTVVPVEVTLADLNTDYQAKLVKVNNVTITGTGNFVNATNYNITDPTGSGVLRTAYADLNYIGQPIPTVAQNITGVVLQYGATTQFVPRSTSDFETYIPVNATLTANPTSLSGFSYVAGSGPSTSQSFNISGVNLTGYPGNLTVSGSTDYEVSADNLTFGSSALIPYTSATLSPTAVYVRLKSGLSTGTYNSEVISVSGGGALLTADVSCNGFVLAPEPSNHVTNFSAGTTTLSEIPLSWTDATGAVLPDSYLIKGSDVSYAAITDPVDGVPEANSALVHNINYGTGNYTFTGLQPSTPYYFKIYSYTNSGSAIDYKLGAVPNATATTQSPVQVTYTWIGEDNASWVTSTNWNPERTTPSATDILLFNDGTSKTITGVPTETVAQVQVINNTIINLQSSAVVTLSIAGSAGTDLIVSAGSALNLNAANAITINLLSGATASISGAIKFSASATTAHRLTSADAGGITFNSGSSFTAGTNFSGNAFGTTRANSVIFAAGSVYICQAGSNPFALTQPASVVVFQTGSVYKHQTTNSPSFGGRVYADFEYDFNGTTSATGSTAVAIDNLTITQGVFNFNVTATPGHVIKGNISVANSATLNFNPSTAGTVKLQGTGTHTISGGGTLTTGANSTLDIDNAAGVNLGIPITINGSLKLTNGLFTLGSSDLVIGLTGSIAGTPSATNMIVATGTGELRKLFSANGSFTYPVGDNDGIAEYSPVTITFTAGTYSSAYAAVNLVNSAYPGSTGNYLKRYWNISSSGITDFICNTQFNYPEADVEGNESSIYCVLISPPTNYDPANAALHQLTATGVSSFGTFTGRNPFVSSRTLNLKAYLEGFVAAREGIPPAPGYMYKTQLSDGSTTWDAFAGTIADTLTVALANEAAPFDIVYYAHYVNLNTDGTMTLSVPSTFGGSYYIVLQHRQYIETWSGTAVSFAAGTVDYDFSASAGQAFGSNQKSLGAGWGYGLYCGDLVKDGYIELGEVNNTYISARSAQYSYLIYDFTGNGFVELDDVNLIYSNYRSGKQRLAPDTTK